MFEFAAKSRVRAGVKLSLRRGVALLAVSLAAGSPAFAKAGPSKAAAQKAVVPSSAELAAGLARDRAGAALREEKYPAAVLDASGCLAALKAQTAAIKNLELAGDCALIVARARFQLGDLSGAAEALADQKGKLGGLEAYGEKLSRASGAAPRRECESNRKRRFMRVAALDPNGPAGREGFRAGLGGCALRCWRCSSAAAAQAGRASGASRTVGGGARRAWPGHGCVLLAALAIGAAASDAGATESAVSAGRATACSGAREQRRRRAISGAIFPIIRRRKRSRRSRHNWPRSPEVRSQSHPGAIGLTRARSSSSTLACPSWRRPGGANRAPASLRRRAVGGGSWFLGAPRWQPMDGAARAGPPLAEAAKSGEPRVASGGDVAPRPRARPPRGK